MLVRITYDRSATWLLNNTARPLGLILCFGNFYNHTMKTLDEYIKIIENIDLEKDKDYQQEDSYEEFFFEKLKHLILADYKNEEANRERRRSERIKP